MENLKLECNMTVTLLFMHSVQFGGQVILLDRGVLLSR